MQISAHQVQQPRKQRAPFARRFRSLLSIRVITIAAFASGLALACNLGSSQRQGAQDRSIVNPAAGGAPNAAGPMAMAWQQSKPAGPDSANSDRRRQITDDSAKLLKLAGDLKTAVDKSSKDTLSIGVIRKADEIEKLARSVKEKMKPTIGAN